MSDLIEIKKVIDQQGEAFEAFKKAQDALLQAKADGKAVGDLEAKVANLGDALDKFAEQKAAIDDLLVKAARPGGLSGIDPKDAAAQAAELKGFNLSLRAEYQSKGRSFPGELSQDAYAQYKSGFFKLVAGTSVDNLTSDERKAMSAGSDPDGGYLLPNSTMGRMVTRLYEQSIMRQICDVQTISTDKIEGVIDINEASAGWVSELGSRTDSSTPQVGKWEIQAHEMYAMPKISQKLIDDAAAVYPTPDAAFAGGLDRLKQQLGW